MPVARPRDAAPLGVVYTPADVARAMVELALAPLVERARDAAGLLALRVCDPAIGEGAFLVEIVDALATRVHAAWQREGALRTLAQARREVARRCVFGVDIDARAVDHARHAIGAGARLKVADALALDWRAAFPDASNGFDLVIGNPPYIRQEHLADKTALRAYASYDGVADLYVYFLELAHRIARPGGRYCLITPNKWLTVAYGRPLRRFLAKQRSVEGLVDLARASLFAGADAFPSIVWGTVGTSLRAPIRAARLTSRDALAELGGGAPHDRARWTEAPWHIDAPADRALIDELARRWPRFGDVVPGRPARGIVTGYNRAFVIDRATRDRLLAAHPEAAHLVRPLLKGRDIRPYVAARADRHVLLVDHGTSLDAFPQLLAHLARFRDALEPKRTRDQPGGGRKPGPYRWYELQDPVGELTASAAPRLFFQDIQTAPACCLDASGLVPDTTVWALPTADRYLLAVLNSPLYGWYARRRFPPALNGAVRPKLDYIRGLPIATPAPAARAEIEHLVELRVAGRRDLDAAIAEAVLGCYDLTARQRALVTAPG